MSYESLTVLIPSHSLEDLPLDLPEEQAEGLLNAFAVLWHPALIDAAGLLPRWERADDTPPLSPKALVIVPAISRDWLACQWLEDAQESGASVISDVAERSELLARCLEPLDVPPALDDDVAADFIALGHCYLQVELLTRQMRYFSELDEARLEANTLSASRAALAGDATAARNHLRDCFEMLLEARERFYPVDCYLVDVCLLTTATADDDWTRLARSDRTVSYLATAADLDSLAESHRDTFQTIAHHWRNGQQEFIGGELREEATSLLPLDVTIHILRRGLSVFERLFDRRPQVWGRRNYGIGPQVPQLLEKLNYDAGLHYVMDDGLYPDEEQGKFRWEGCDGTVIDATSRIPLAGDSAASFLRFPVRMSESMDYDHAAVIQFARWPQTRTPWLEDFCRIHRFAPVLGRFVTLSEFFHSTDTPGRLTKFKTSQYLSPHLWQSVAREERDPISRYARTWMRQLRLEDWSWLATLAAAIQGRAVKPDDTDQAMDAIVASLPADTELGEMADKRLADLASVARDDLASLLVGRRGEARGVLVLNSCSFTRRLVVDWPSELAAPATAELIISRQQDGERLSLVVEVPPSGFVWIPAGRGDSQQSKKRADRIPLAEENVLRNEFFEVGLSPETGGLASLKTYSRGPNRLSQQVAFRYRHERIAQIGDDEDPQELRTHYTTMRQTRSEILCTGPGVGSIRTAGTLVDPQTQELLGEFSQTITVRRGRPLVEIDLTIDVHKQPEGDPWAEYYACRWAWNDPDASLTASVHEGAHPVEAERFEAPHYVEVASDEIRTTILPHGLTFHRKAGPRMLDTLLVTANESCRDFRFVVAVDDAYPMERARDCMLPTTTIVRHDGPAEVTSGWLFHLDALNVQITRLLPLHTQASDSAAKSPAQEATTGFGLRLRETEGRHRTVRLRCYRPPSSARQVDLIGNTINVLTLDGDAVKVEVAPYELCDVEVRFDEPPSGP